MLMAMVIHAYEIAGQGTDSRCIYLIRHAKPAVPELKSGTYEEIVTYYDLYDKVDVVPFDKNIILERISEPLPEFVFTSRLPRAVQTAEQTFGDRMKYENRKIFNEFGRTVLKFKRITMRKGAWSTLSRLTWAMGFSGDTESFKEARYRAGVCAGVLSEVSGQQDVTILVGHGFMNHFIKKKLKKMGWKVEINDGKKNLGVIKMVKEK